MSTEMGFGMIFMRVGMSKKYMDQKFPFAIRFIVRPIIRAS